MKRRMKAWAMAAVAIAVLFLTVSAQAGDWRKKADLFSGGGGKEVTVDANIKAVKIRCLDGSVIINTIWVREGGRKTQHKVTRRLEKGEEHILHLDTTRYVTGLRIGDDARGKYRVWVKN